MSAFVGIVTDIGGISLDVDYINKTTYEIIYHSFD